MDENLKSDERFKLKALEARASVAQASTTPLPGQVATPLPEKTPSVAPATSPVARVQMPQCGDVSRPILDLATMLAATKRGAPLVGQGRATPYGDVSSPIISLSNAPRVVSTGGESSTQPLSARSPMAGPPGVVPWGGAWAQSAGESQPQAALPDVEVIYEKEGRDPNLPPEVDPETTSLVVIVVGGPGSIPPCKSGYTVYEYSFGNSYWVGTMVAAGRGRIGPLSIPGIERGRKEMSYSKAYQNEVWQRHVAANKLNENPKDESVQPILDTPGNLDKGAFIPEGFTGTHFIEIALIWHFVPDRGSECLDFWLYWCYWKTEEWENGKLKHKSSKAGAAKVKVSASPDEGNGSFCENWFDANSPKRR